MIVRGMNSRRRLRSTTRSRSSSAPKAMRLEVAVERVGNRSPVGAVAAISLAAPFRSG